MTDKARLCKCGCGRELVDATSDFFMPSHQKALRDSRKKQSVPQHGKRLGVLMAARERNATPRATVATPMRIALIRIGCGRGLAGRDRPEKWAAFLSLPKRHVCGKQRSLGN